MQGTLLVVCFYCLWYGDDLFSVVTMTTTFYSCDTSQYPTYIYTYY